MHISMDFVNRSNGQGEKEVYNSSVDNSYIFQIYFKAEGNTVYVYIYQDSVWYKMTYDTFKKINEQNSSSSDETSNEDTVYYDYPFSAKHMIDIIDSCNVEKEDTATLRSGTATKYKVTVPISYIKDFKDMYFHDDLSEVSSSQNFTVYYWVDDKTGYISKIQVDFAGLYTKIANKDKGTSALSVANFTGEYYDCDSKDSIQLPSGASNAQLISQ